MQTQSIAFSKTQQQEIMPQGHNQRVVELIRRLFEPDMSPLLAPESMLQHVPRTYLVSVEFDPLKDEGLLYAERLREAGVPVTVAFYEDAFHSQATLTSSFPIARQIQSEILSYIFKHV